MYGALLDGEPRPAGVIYEDGSVVSDFRFHTDSDGRRMFSCGECNREAEQRTAEVDQVMLWAIDEAGILVRR